MGALEFDWDALPDDLAPLIPAEIRRDLPTPDSVRELWPAIRDGWLLTDLDRTTRFATLLDAVGASRTARRQATSDVDFVRSVRNSSGLRLALARYILALGSPSGPADDPAEIAARPDRVSMELATPDPGQSPAIDDPEPVIPGPDFAPRSTADFARLSQLRGFQWARWTLAAFNRIEELLPGERFYAQAWLDEPANDPSVDCHYGLLFVRDSTTTLHVILGPEKYLPAGLFYSSLHPMLTNLGWQVAQTGGISVTLSWPDGGDDAAALAAETFRSVFLIDSAARLVLSDEIRPGGDRLPAAPHPEDVIRPDGPANLLMVAGALIRQAGGSVLPEADPHTHEFTVGSFLGWIHADPSEPILDVVVVVASRARPGDEAFGVSELDYSRFLDLQSRSLRFGRFVMTDSEVLLAGSMPVSLCTGASLTRFLRGMVDEAASAIGAAPTNHPLPAGMGGYL